MELAQYLEIAEQELVKAQDKVAQLKAEIYFVNLFDTATYKNVGMAKYNDGRVEIDLRPGCDVLYFLGNKSLVKTIQDMASHFKFMDDSQTWPTWKNEAVKQAKILQELFNKRNN